MEKSRGLELDARFRDGPPALGISLKHLNLGDDEEVYHPPQISRAD